MSNEADNAAITDSESFKSKVKITGKIPTDGYTKDSKTAVPLTYF